MARLWAAHVGFDRALGYGLKAFVVSGAVGGVVMIGAAIVILRTASSRDAWVGRA